MSEKTCVLCGEDCSGKPRTKDARGRYYCQPCYDEAKRQVDARKAAAAAPPPPPPIAPGLGQQGCPGCGAPMTPGAVVCISCGYDVRKGEAVAPTVAAAKPSRAPKGDRPAVWPLVVGILSLCLGGLGMITYGPSLIVVVQSMPWSENRLTSTIGLLAGALAFLMSTWLTLGGFGVVRRRARGVTHLRRWSIVMIALAVLFGGCITFALISAPRSADGLPGAAAALVALLAISAAITLAWPIFLLIWLGRAKVQASYHDWDY